MNFSLLGIIGNYNRLFFLQKLTIFYFLNNGFFVRDRFYFEVQIDIEFPSNPVEPNIFLFSAKSPDKGQNIIFLHVWADQTQKSAVSEFQIWVVLPC